MLHVWHQPRRRADGLGDGYPAPPFGPPVGAGGRRAEVRHAAGAGQLIDVGGDPMQDRGYPGQVGHQVRPVDRLRGATARAWAPLQDVAANWLDGFRCLRGVAVAWLPCGWDI
jgi:hypothetical protein